MIDLIDFVEFPYEILSVGFYGAVIYSDDNKIKFATYSPIKVVVHAELGLIIGDVKYHYVNCKQHKNRIPLYIYYMQKLHSATLAAGSPDIGIVHYIQGYLDHVNISRDVYNAYDWEFIPDFPDEIYNVMYYPAGDRNIINDPVCESQSLYAEKMFTPIHRNIHLKRTNPPRVKK